MSKNDVYFNGGIIGQNIDLGSSDFYNIVSVNPGEQAYTTPGTFSWTAPAEVTSVSVVCVGGGGGGTSSNGSGGAGGGGGGLGWKNNIAVTPGQSYTVVVGAAGTRATSTTATTATSGGQSYFISAATVAGNGGARAVSNTSGGAGGTFAGDGGGNGGNGGNAGSTSAGGGGGAGGYSGNGGAGGSTGAAGAAGAGGGAGGGGSGGSSDAGGGGGGVGILGQGANGTAGTYTGGNGGGGGAGSGGVNGVTGGSTATPANGGAYGGGGAGAEILNEHGSGESGAVRIIWGTSRAFPSTNTADGAGEPIIVSKENRKNSGIWDIRSISQYYYMNVNRALSLENRFKTETRSPLDIFAWTSTNSVNSTFTRDTSVTDSPFGGVPLRMAITANDPYAASYGTSTWNIASAQTGQTWEVRVLAKASVATTGEIFIFGANSSGTALTSSFGNNYGAGTISIRTDWTESSFRLTFNDSNVSFIQCRLDGTQTGGTGINIWWDGLQVYRIN